MEVFGLLAFITSLITLAIMAYVGYKLSQKKYNIDKIVEKKIGNQLKSTLGIKGTELKTATDRIERDIMAIMNKYPEEIEEYMPSLKEYSIDRNRPDLAIGGIVGFFLKLLPIFIAQSPNAPEGTAQAIQVASTVASSGALDHILGFISAFRNRENKPRETRQKEVIPSAKLTYD